ncbi:hypothetical protein QOZ95_005499 [Paenibacillus brasilensis]|uniref:Uncharacterized protein n=1 Tax=Paenibacillus brasilensis TaxID=128574 RepID=A0ABU0L7M4_9BACL|nr:hypothetical protein [Paenibacillus brasilensis]
MNWKSSTDLNPFGNGQMQILKKAGCLLTFFFLSQCKPPSAARLAAN